MDTILTELGEGPYWDTETAQVIWVDLLAGNVNFLDPDTGVCEVRSVDEPVGAIVRAGRNWLLTVETGFQLRGPEWDLLWSKEIFAKPTPVRMNDAACDPRGRLFAGSLSCHDEPGQGCLFRLDPDGSCRVVVEGLGISNGIAWSPDQRTFYHVDSLARTVYARPYTVETGDVGPATVFYRHEADQALPDGIAVDVAGGMWIALWDGARVIRVDRDGAITDVVTLPALRVTSVAFGGPDLRTLFATSARVGLDDATLQQYPGSGQLHTFTTPISGLPVFGGPTTAGDLR
nr:SMP-30/gluconolactonase/LRE family protein [Kibdelosporangium sp. MJ126-NF4]CEL14112.1 Gluconolactonase [Kibdelosporangium sp. MJ126-NF4]CTQ88479.1 Gluconolactonase (EC 3.1.1.17) [Kibdelosporangium sp. MJ126-NF4]